jgi:diaminopimelate epimerase
MASLEFLKMHAAGNDFVVLDMFNPATARIVEKLEFEKFAKSVCDRHFGVGADGILLVFPPKSKENDAAMRIINSDGSEAEMCGNGIRCVSKFIVDKGYCTKNQLNVETMSGIKLITVYGNSFKVDMGAPRILRKEIPMNGKGDCMVVNEQVQLKYKKVNLTAVSMGNPHAIVFIDDLDFDIEEMGKEIEHHQIFPKKTNVEFVHVLGMDNIELRVWERGVGETLACGTGACASVVACVLNEKTSRNVTVSLPGGSLQIEWQEAPGNKGHVIMSGTATTAFSGKMDVLNS